MNKLSSLHVLTVCLLMLLLALPVSIRLAPESYDYVQHQLFALVWASEGTLPGPHFLYQALLLGVQALLPVANLPTIAVAINAVALISTGLLVFGLLYAALPRSQSAIGALALTVVLLLAAPASFPSWHSGVYYLSYISPNSYHNPTIWLMKPFALGLYLLVLRIEPARRSSWRIILLAILVAIGGVLAKPNFIIAVIPALGLVTLVNLVQRRPLDWLLLLAIAVPSSLILAWQLFFYQGEYDSGFVLAPLEMMAYWTGSSNPVMLLLRFGLSIGFPLAVLILYWPALRQDRGVILAWLTFATGALYTYLLAETGYVNDGNFGWSAEIGLFLLFVMSALLVIRQEGAVLDGQKRPGWRFWLASGALSLHLISGIVFYFNNLSTGQYT